MGQHAKRFSAVNAPKGGGLRAVADQLKVIADIAEDWYDPNSAEVVGAMQRFEQGLALLTTAPANPESGEPDEEEKPRTRRASKKDAKASGSDDTPGNTAEGQGTTDA